MGIIAGNAPVKPRVLFYAVGGITAFTAQNNAVNACMGLYCSKAKEKPCTLSRCKAKEKPGHF